MDVAFNVRKFVSVEYPGVVKNEDKALATLGGESAVSKVYSESSRRLELRYRPKDIYCKSAHGDRFNTSSLLMRVVRKKRKSPNGAETESEDKDLKIEIIGIINTTYKFRALMDFQYLPMERIGDTYKSLVPKLIPNELHLYSWVNGEAPVFLQPPLFSRLDTPMVYHYHKEPQHRQKDQPQIKHPANIIGRTRQRRAGFAIFINFEEKEIPTKPIEAAVENLKQRSHICDPDLLERLNKCFEEVPIWSRNALVHKLNCERVRLKFQLPAAAYYFLTGPWRSLWVKFGYDPRKDPSAIIYQVLDFRVRQPVGEKLPIKSKRSAYYYVLPTKMSQPQAHIATIQTKGLTEKPDSNIPTEKKNKSEEDKELYYIFKPGCLPQYRQVFYQLCNIQIDEVQKLIQSNNRRQTCHEKDGWCLPGVLDKCREIMAEYVRKVIQKKKEEEKQATEEQAAGQNEGSDESDQDFVASDQEMDPTEMDEFFEYTEPD